MNIEELTALASQIEAAARDAGAMMLGAEADKSVSTKSGRKDLVTRYDKEIQRFLEERLLPLLPEAGFLGEEALGHDAHTERDFLFIVDPIDGTTNFVKGCNQSCVSIGLGIRGEMAVGVVFNPYRDEMFTAVRGGGALLNGAPLRIPDCAPEDALVLVGSSPYYRELTDVTFAMARLLFDRCLDLRRSGSAALDLCDVAAGRAGCYFECRLSPWDFAAGGLIVREAGGVVTDLTGGPLAFAQKCPVAAGNPQCHPALLQAAKDCGFSG